MGFCVLIVWFSIHACFMTSVLSSPSCSAMSLMGRFFLYSLRMRCMSAATVALLFFPNFCDCTRSGFALRSVRAASYLYGKCEMLSWHETVLSAVSHSLSVSGSFSLQLLCHSGFH